MLESRRGAKTAIVALLCLNGTQSRRPPGAESKPSPAAESPSRSVARLPIRAKDEVEACLARAVCARRIALDEARRRIWNDWREAGMASQ